MTAPVCPKCGTTLQTAGTEAFCPRCWNETVAAGARAAAAERGSTEEEQARRRSPTRPRPHIPDHHLLRLIGCGSYGEVWLARNVVGTARAVKVVWRKDFQHDRPYDREFEGIQKYEPLSRSHEGLVDILHLGRNDKEGFFYYIMELADNAAGSGADLADPSRPVLLLSLSNPAEVADYKPKTLREVMRRRGRLGPDECLGIGVRLAAALEHLHKAGLVHRDVKPSNIIFVDGCPKLADIGLVAGIDEEASFVGTEGFVPPEGPGAPSADLFSLGKVLYEISTGLDRHEFPRLPAGGSWGGESDAEALSELNEILLRACEPKAAHRYQNAAELRSDLTLLQSGKSIRRLRRLEQRVAWLNRVGLAAGIVALLALGAYYGSVKQIQRAQHAEAQARERSSRLQRQKAEEFLARDQTAEGLASLARVVREHPSDRAAIERLLAALSWRAFALPLTEPIRAPERADAVCFSPDGQEFLIATATGDLEFRAFPTGALREAPWRLSGRVMDACYSPDGHRVAVAIVSNAFILDRATGERLTPDLIHQARVRELHFSPQGDRLVTCGRDEVARIWDSRTGQPLGQLLKHQGYVRSVVFSPDGRKVATGSYDWSARIWDAYTGEPLTPPLRHEAGVLSVRFSSDGERLVTAAEDHTARMWDATTGQMLRVLSHRGAVRLAKFSPDGQRVVTCSEDCTARLWDAQSGKPLGQAMMHRGWVTCVEFSPDGRRVLTGSDDNTVRVWDGFNGKAVSQPLRHQQEIVVARFSQDGQAVISSAKDHVVCLWQAEANQAHGFQMPLEAPAAAARFSPCGSFLAVACQDGFLRLWNTGDLHTLRAAWPHEAPLKDLAFSCDGGRLVTIARDQTARVWDVNTLKPVSPPLPHPQSIHGARLSEDGRLLVTACGDGVARIWNVATGEQVGPLLKHDLVIVHAEFDRTGRLLLTASGDDTACLWDLETGKELHRFQHTHSLTSAAFRQDGRRVVTASVDRTAQVWDTQTGHAVGRPMIHDSDVTVAQFSSDGRFVVTASRDRTARVWNAVTGEPVSEVLLHDGIVRSANLSSDGLRVLTSSEDDTVRLWDAMTGLPLSDPFPQDGPARHAEFSPFDRLFLTVTASGKVYVYESFQVDSLAPVWLADLAETVGGKRLNEKDLLEATSPESLRRLVSSLKDLPGTDIFARWARWFADETSTRTISPSSPILDAQRFRPDASMRAANTD